MPALTSAVQPFSSSQGASLILGGPGRLRGSILLYVADRLPLLVAGKRVVAGKRARRSRLVILAFSLGLATCPRAAEAAAPAHAKTSDAKTDAPELSTNTRAPAASETESEVSTSEGKRKSTPDGLWGPRFGGHHFELSVLLDYARATGAVSGLSLEPYALGLNFSASYVFSGGLRLGVVGDLYAGKTLSQVYHPPLSTLEIDLNAQSQLADVGLLVGYDQPLGPVVLRYALAVNVGILSWNFGDLPYEELAGFSPMQGTRVAPSLDTSFGVVWPIRFFFVSGQVHYRLSLSPSLPAAFGAGLGLGVHF